MICLNLACTDQISNPNQHYRQNHSIISIDEYLKSIYNLSKMSKNFKVNNESKDTAQINNLLNLKQNCMSVYSLIDEINAIYKQISPTYEIYSQLVSQIPQDQFKLEEIMYLKRYFNIRLNNKGVALLEQTNTFDLSIPQSTESSLISIKNKLFDEMKLFQAKLLQDLKKVFQNESGRPCQALNDIILNPITQKEREPMKKHRKSKQQNIQNTGDSNDDQEIMDILKNYKEHQKSSDSNNKIPKNQTKSTFNFNSGESLNSDHFNDENDSQLLYQQKIDQLSLQAVRMEEEDMYQQKEKEKNSDQSNDSLDKIKKPQSRFKNDDQRKIFQSIQTEKIQVSKTNVNGHSALDEDFDQTFLSEQFEENDKKFEQEQEKEKGNKSFSDNDQSNDQSQQPEYQYQDNLRKLILDPKIEIKDEEECNFTSIKEGLIRLNLTSYSNNDQLEKSQKFLDERIRLIKESFPPMDQKPVQQIQYERKIKQQKEGKIQKQLQEQLLNGFSSESDKDDQLDNQKISQIKNIESDPRPKFQHKFSSDEQKGQNETGKKEDDNLLKNLRVIRNQKKTVLLRQMLIDQLLNDGETSHPETTFRLFSTASVHKGYSDQKQLEIISDFYLNTRNYRLTAEQYHVTLQNLYTWIYYLRKQCRLNHEAMQKLFIDAKAEKFALTQQIQIPDERFFEIENEAPKIIISQKNIFSSPSSNSQASFSVEQVDDQEPNSEE